MQCQCQAGVLLSWGWIRSAVLEVVGIRERPAGWDAVGGREYGPCRLFDEAGESTSWLRKGDEQRYHLQSRPGNNDETQKTRKREMKTGRLRYFKVHAEPEHHHLSHTLVSPCVFFLSLCQSVSCSSQQSCAEHGRNASCLFNALGVPWFRLSVA